MKSISRLTASLVLVLGLANAAHATQQCFRAGGPTVYGGVTVTVTGCSDYGSAFTPFAVNESQLISSGGTCTYSFSKPLTTSTLSVQVNSLDPSAALAVTTSAGAYTSAAGDIGTPLAGSGSTGTILLNGTGYIGAAPEASGTLTLTNSAPASITSIALTQTGGSGSLLKVCADDGGVTAAAATVPTLSEWGLALTTALLAVLTAFTLSRSSRKNKQPAS